MALLDHRGGDARDADAVATHLRRHRLLRRVEHGEFHRLGVPAAELEDVSHLDTAHELQCALAVGRRIALRHPAQVSDLRLRAVAAPVHAGAVELGLVDAAGEIGELRRSCVGDHRHGRTHGAEESRRALERGADLFLGGERQRRGHQRMARGLERVEHVVAAQRECDDIARARSGLAALDHDQLERADERQVQQRRDFLAGGLLGRRGIGHRFGRRGTRREIRHDIRGLDVRGIGATVGHRQQVLAGIRQHVEFLRGRAPDVAGVGFHNPERNAQAREDFRVSDAHVVVLALQVLDAHVEAVRVLHDEFACAHHAEARADLVTELGLDLVEVHRQLPVRTQVLARVESDDLFVRRAVAVVARVAILDAQQLRAHFFPPARLLPQLGRVDARHQHLERAGAVHFLAHDRLDLVQHAHADRQPGVEPLAQRADVARAQQQLVADDFGVGRGFLGGREGELAEAHGHGGRTGRRIMSFPRTRA